MPEVRNITIPTLELRPDAQVSYLQHDLEAVMSEFVLVKRELLGRLDCARNLKVALDAGEELRAVLAQEAGKVEPVAYLIECEYRASTTYSQSGKVERFERWREVSFEKNRRPRSEVVRDVTVTPLYTSPPAPVLVTDMRAFSNAMIDIALEGGDADGAHIQELAVKHSLLKPEQRTERCGESCSCAEFADFPVECFRKVKELNQ